MSDLLGPKVTGNVKSPVTSIERRLLVLPLPAWWGHDGRASERVAVRCDRYATASRFQTLNCRASVGVLRGTRLRA